MQCPRLCFAIERKMRWLLPALFLLALFPLPDPLFEKDYSTVVYAMKGELLRVYLNGDEQYFFPPDSGFVLPEKLQQCIIAYEDRNFYVHPGIDPLAVIRALYQNIRAGAIVSGASTITMQLARMVERRPRTLWQKLIEMIWALKIEVHFSKRDILRLYVQHAPYGGNIIGVEAAQHRYFNTPFSQMTWGQAALLAVLPNAPGSITPTRQPEKLLRKRNALLRTLFAEEIIDSTTMVLAAMEAIPDSRFTFPFHAPHLGDALLLSKHRSQRVTTSIDAAVQSNIEQITAAYGQQLKYEGIANCAVLVVANKSRSVLAYIGSADYFDNPNSGMVNGVLAPRSSGSVFKPFLYGLGIDAGLLSTESLIHDVPSYYGVFSPANANKSFLGIVRVKDALAKSLNIPAVRVLNAYGVQTFYEFLQMGGVRTLFRNSEEYGLPLILGGAEVNLFDLAQLYSGLANDGIFRELTVLANDSRVYPAKQLLSRGAAYQVLEMLTNLKRPGIEFFWESFATSKKISWKTGTSYGNRDAWALGVDPEYTVAVWVGNFNGKENPAIKGMQKAGPLLFSVFNYLQSKAAFFKNPLGAMKTISLCSHSGYQATDLCPDPIPFSVPKNAAMLRSCQFHKEIFVDTRTGREVCSMCWTNGKYRKKVIMEHSPDVHTYAEKAGLILEKRPLHNSECPAFHEKNPIQIIYPVAGTTIWQPRDLDGNLQKIMLKAVHQHPEQKLYWYLDGKYLGYTEKIHTLNVNIPPGKHNLLLVDEAGHRNNRQFTSHRSRKTAN
jgi:penicillin-binding protein 1C